MDSLVLLSVLAITQTIVLARPTDMDLKTKRSVEENSGEIFNPLFIKFPTEIRHGFTVTINGTLDVANKTFEAVLPAIDKEEKDHCRITYDFESKTVNVSPAPPGENNLFDYEIIGKLDNSDGGYPTFSIKLRARSMDKNSMFKLTFEANGGGESPLVSCPIENFEDYTYIEFRNGVHNITSLLFEF